MIDLSAVHGGTGHAVLSRAPDGHDARIVAELARQHDAPLLLIVPDDARLAGMLDCLRFFAADLDIVDLPAWDCLPYDRVSPNMPLSARRMHAFSRLAGPEGPRPDIVVTTVNAVVQQVPPRAVLAPLSRSLKPGDQCALEDLLRVLGDNGFHRAGTVMEAGEFALRGGILDVFTPDGGQPLRLDFFGDTLEAVRTFDPLTQRTTGTAEGLTIAPVSEVILNEETIARFRRGYRELFGVGASSDPLYEAVSAGTRPAGMEHFLPLFYDRLETLFDYVAPALVLTEPHFDEMRQARLEQIGEHHAAREEALAGRLDTLGAYRPVPVERLYLNDDLWRDLTVDRDLAEFTPFEPPAGERVIDCAGDSGRRFAAERALDGADTAFDTFRAYARDAVAQGARVLLCAYSPGSADRLRTLLDEHDITAVQAVDDAAGLAALPADMLALTVLGLENGFRSPDLVVVTEQDLLGERIVRRRRGRAADFISEAAELTPGDLVVHVDHGIGRFEGLETIRANGAPHDCVALIYAGGDRLFVPVENIEMLSRYGAETAGAELDRLGGAGWQARKARLKDRIRDMADQLIKTAAERQMKKATVIAPPQGLYDEFAAHFPFQETEDQNRAIADTLEDLRTGRPMDRLICGDVGFGKTEVALRAAYCTAMDGGQVAVVTPTTLLCRQHFKTFAERFAGTGIRVRQLSRLVPPKEAKETREGLANGDIQVIVGTHALLAKSVSFANLELLIVDEEQHFGVKHKERLKELRADVHVLTLTATPIPRTLQLGLAGVKDLSLIATPPVDRLAVRTFVSPFDQVVLREAIMREKYRGGQIFFVCPRIADLEEAQERLKQIAPEVKFITAHGRMPARQLEDVMEAFYDGAYDVLISTTIVESGLDIPTANTMIIYRADMFGLAQLYQLRGRIGRSKLRAYCYLTLPDRKKPTEGALKRLKVLQSLDSLGAGFTLASHDLDLRGAGNLLGEEQSGHIKEVGIELYQQLLEEAVAAARSGDAGALDLDEEWTPQINLATAVMIPESYVPDLESRLGLYRRISRLENRAEIDDIAAELVDRFGPLPGDVDNLLKVVEIKQFCRRANVAKVDTGPRGAVLSFRNDSFANPAGLVSFIATQKGTATLRPDHALVLRRSWETPDATLKGVRGLVGRLAKIVREGEQTAARAG